MYKKVQVVMLSTNEKASICLDYNKLTLHQTDLVNCTQNWQHLYFLSDEEIKEGDWYYQYNPYGSVIDKCDDKSPFVAKSARYIWENGGKKIIATTDKSLKIITGIVGSGTGIPLPQPSQDFIKVFVEEYNKGNVIEWVDVDYEYEVCPNSSVENHNYFKLKVNSKNEITIRKIKESWNREEVIELLQNCWSDSAFNLAKQTNNEDFVTFDKWISENL